MKSFAFLIILSPGLVSINSYVTGLCCQLLCYWSLLSEVQNDQVHYTSIQINIKRQHASRFHAQLLYQLIKPNLYRHQQKCDHQRDTTETAVLFLNGTESLIHLNHFFSCLWQLLENYLHNFHMDWVQQLQMFGGNPLTQTNQNFKSGQLVHRNQICTTD